MALSSSALASDEDEAWTPTPPRLSFIDGKVSYWRQGAEDWARARPNLALAEGDALYTGKGANLEVQFGSRSFVRADENSQLSLEFWLIALPGVVNHKYRNIKRRLFPHGERCSSLP